ncbi:styrene monooxygenase/indole monooxygenase family protein [Millisia brevis]|uniref:styrene monooxygenase/indole monooxygenase family protein n=1 Tax=Millisia brevis TaxID=264148 RepID=UPI00082CDD14|nr:styrene monooxygenase/indole monooxygenase family protein [Millisia brevis]
MSRTAAVIGAGLAGSSAALGLARAGFRVTLYSDRERADLRDALPATGTAVYFGNDARAADARVAEDHYADSHHSLGNSVRIHAADGSPAIAFDGAFTYRAQAVDVRLRTDDRIGDFLDAGGTFEVRPIDPEALDRIAADADLTVVATGKGALASLFPVDEQRSVYRTPQRQLLTVTLAGLDYSPEPWAYRTDRGGDYNLFNIHATQGEIWIGPYLHKDAGPAWSLLGWARPDGEWPARFDRATDAASARQVFVDLIRDYFPDDLPTVERLQVIDADPQSWLRGAVTPTVRRPVGSTASGHPVAAIGDTAIAFDPITGQGAQNSIIQVADLVEAAADHTGPFTEQWLREQFDRHWERRGLGASEVTRLYLGDPDYAVHAELAFPAAAVSPAVAQSLFTLLDVPNPILDVRTREEVLGFIGAVAGEPAEDVLARFEPGFASAARL